MSIRPYRESDHEKIREITGICFDGVSIDQNMEKLYGSIGGTDWRYRKILDVDGFVSSYTRGVFVAESGGEVVGYVSSRPDERTRIGGISNLAVLPGHQGKGLGNLLIDAALAFLQECGMEFVTIESLDQNPVAMHLYEKRDFTEIARKVYYMKPVGRRGGRDDHKETG